MAKNKDDLFSILRGLSPSKVDTGSIDQIVSNFGDQYVMEMLTPHEVGDKLYGSMDPQDIMEIIDDTDK